MLLQQQPRRSGIYRENAYDLEKKGMFDVKEQRLLDQKWQFVTKKWFSDLELNEIKEKSMGVTEESEENGCQGSVGFGEEDNVVCENECHVVLEDICLNQDRYSNNEFEVVTRLAMKHGSLTRRWKWNIRTTHYICK